MLLIGKNIKQILSFVVSNRIIAVDFDGTIVPKIPNGSCDLDTGAERVLRKLLDSGDRIILYTCRNNSHSNPYNYYKGEWRKETSLNEAIRWFKERNLELSGINKRPNQKQHIGDSLKPYVDIIIDDTCLGIKLKNVIVDYKTHSGEEIKNFPSYHVDWDWVEKELGI